MPRITNPNIEILELAANQLDDLVARVVFLGGCATGLLLTDPREVGDVLQIISYLRQVFSRDSVVGLGGGPRQQMGL
jgi:hypothetical protein